MMLVTAQEVNDLVNLTVELGRIGWDGWPEHFDQGDPDSIDPRGKHTLVRVTLYRGVGNPAKVNAGGQIEGPQVLARLGSAMSGIPPKGTNVYCIVPNMLAGTNGAHMIIGAYENAPRTNLTAGQKTLAAAEGAAKVVVGNDNSLSLFTTDDGTDNGKSVYVRVASDGFTFAAPWGTLKFDATGFHVLHASGASFDLGGIYGLPTPLDQITSYVRMSAATINGRCSAASFGADTPEPLAGATALTTIIDLLVTAVTAPTGGGAVPGLGAADVTSIRTALAELAKATSSS